MIINETRHAALIVLASCAASAAYTQTSRPQNGEFVRLDRPAVFDTNPNTGSLKESVQNGQQLVWHPKEKPNEPRAMALQHHRWAGMCRSTEFREEHFRWEQEFLALADSEERLHGGCAEEQASNPAGENRRVQVGSTMRISFGRHPPTVGADSAR